MGLGFAEIGCALEDVLAKHLLVRHIRGILKEDKVIVDCGG